MYRAINTNGASLAMLMDRRTNVGTIWKGCLLQV